MATFKINELGCKVNQYESQLMREQLNRAGFTEASNKPADIYVINTCTVTAAADSDSRNFIRRAMRYNPDAKIVVTGCYVEKDADEIKKICKDAVIVKNEQKNDIIDIIGDCRGTARRAPTYNGISDFAGHNRAFVKIQDGCDNYCSYCKVPFVRGRSKSRKIKDILNEISSLVNTDFKEIVLCGICLGDYKDLTVLLEKLERIEGLKRIRLSSVEPVYVNKDLIDKMASSKKICRHLHIPLQSGDDSILKTMNRRYTSKEYVDLVKGICRQIPDIAISTDILVGFPGETRKNFDNTLETIKAFKPMRIHAFSYSKRGQTKAFNMPGPVQKSETSWRMAALRELSQNLSFSYRNKFKGREVEVLVENDRDKKTNLLTGYTDTYIKVLFEEKDNIVNELINVEITDVSGDSTMGRLK